MGTADVRGAGRYSGPSSFSPPMPWMRDPIKSKGAAPPVTPAEAPWGEESDTAFTCQLQQEEQRAEAV